MKRYDLEWQVGYSNSSFHSPERWVPAQVPGAVQLDWAKSESWEHYTYADHWQDYLWMEDVFWTYRTRLRFDRSDPQSRLYFVSKGIDYKFEVRLNGTVIHSQEGMFTPVELDLTPLAAPADELEIIVYPAPKREGAPHGRKQADQSCKPAVSYGWDWHPRLVPLGIWDDTYLELRPASHIRMAEVRYALNEDFSKASVMLHTELHEPGQAAAGLVWKLADKHGNIVYEQQIDKPAERMTLEFELQAPELWWPNGEGEPLLYTSHVELVDGGNGVLDRSVSRVGFRSASLVMHTDAWKTPREFPKGPSNPPITLQINGRAIFCKGTNWVNPEIFPGIITRDTYEPLLQMAKDAHMNLLRSWGGGIVNKESFFDLCDELGLMVWQEFPLACNNYAGTPDYLAVLDRESRSIIRRLRPHPSVVLWCGGNELYNSWSGMTEQSHTLRLLNRNCFDMNPQTPFLMTSPIMGMGHGHYLFRNFHGQEVFEVMPKASCTAYTEFGIASPSDADILRSFIPEDQLFPPRPDTVWETHHAFDAWIGETWLSPTVLEDYFGESHTLEQLVERGQLLQSEGYKCIFEEARRQKPVCSMALNWCYNEPWPTAANNSIISWPARPKPAYEAVKASCRPVLASARIRKFVWREGELFNPELWILNDSPGKVEAGMVEALLEADGVTVSLLSWSFDSLPPGTNSVGPVIQYRLPDVEAVRFKLILRVPGRPELESEYTLLYRPKKRPDPVQGHTLNVRG